MSHRFHHPLAVAKQLCQGKSLGRALLNLALRGTSVAGRVLDLGAKTGSGSYYQFLKAAPGTEWVYSDKESQGNVVGVDVEKTLPFADQSFDFVLAFNLFEHVFDSHRAPAEIARILKPGGRFLISTPFWHEYHADPQDYYRFTGTALQKIWEASGLKLIKLEAVGEGLFTFVATQLPYLVLPAFLRPWASAILYLPATVLDRLLALRPRVLGKTVAERFALHHLAVFEKQGRS